MEIFFHMEKYFLLFLTEDIKHSKGDKGRKHWKNYRKRQERTGFPARRSSGTDIAC